MATPFNVVKGTEATIKACNPLKGYLWFALDTRKIYYSDGEDFISMGGNSSVFYGTLTWSEDNLPDTDQVEFDFTMDDIEGDATPNVNDLILNSDGCFYRVISVTGTGAFAIIKGLKLTIAGSGSGGGGGDIPVATSIITIAVPTSTKYFLDTEENPTFSFDVHSTRESGNQISKITYTIGSRTYIDDEPHKFGTITLELADYFNFISETGTKLSFVVEDIYGTRKTSSEYTLQKVKLLLSDNDSNKDEILQATEKRYQYRVIPIGSDAIKDVNLVYNIYVEGSRTPIWSHTKSVTVLNGNTISEDLSFTDIDLNGDGLGAYSLEVFCTGTAGGQTIKSNTLTHSIISYGEAPILIAYLPSNKFVQYDNTDILYEIAKTNPDNQKARITFEIDGNITIQEVEYNQIYKYNVYFETTGYHTIFIRDNFGHTQSFTNIFVSQYDGTVQVIDNNDIDLMLNLSARGRNNNEIIENRTLWKDVNTNRPGTAELDNFVWGNVNGWLTDEKNVDMLRVSSGASMVVHGYEPFGLNSNNKEGMETGKSIELDFKISNVTDYSLPLITCLSYTAANEILCGFHITGETATFNTKNIKVTGKEIREGDSEEDQAYNTQIQGLTAKFAEGERIHLTWVIQRKNETYPMIKTYINGIISGITEYTGGGDANSDSIAQNSTTDATEPALLKINSDVGVVDLYNIRVFDKALSDRQVLENYIATLPTTEEKTAVYQNNIGILDPDGNISVNNIESGKYQMKLPYIKFTGGRACRKGKDDDPDPKGYYLNPTATDGAHLPRAKKDYRLIDHFDYVDPNDSSRNIDLYSSVSTEADTLNLINGVVIYGQGTSSMEYPVKNIRVKFKMKDANKKKVKFQVNPNDYPVDILTLKADYMESSSSHNTGTANLVFDSLEALGFRTPGQKYWNKQNPEYKTLTAIRGYPIICFFRPDEKSNFEYIGRYNLNMDKSSEEAFGFLPFPEEEDDVVNVASEDRFGWIENHGIESGTNLDPTEHPYVNAIHCYEFLNNASDLDNFVCRDQYRKAFRDEKLDSFNENETYYLKNGDIYTKVITPNVEEFSDYYIKQNFTKLFYQKTYNDEKKIVANWLTSFESRYPEDSEDVEAFFQMCLWLNSTNPNEATNEPLIEPMYGYSIDSEEYRLAKFTNEFTDHFDKNFVLFYYVLTHVLLMIDSRAKNMMIATWDNQHWFPIFYDMDTMLGLNNYGYNKFDYNVEDKDANVYNGQDSVLWNNLKRCFESDITEMYRNMQEHGGLNYGNLLRNYNTAQADMWNEIMYNYDAVYKYINPYAEGYYDGKNLDENGKPVIIPAGTKNYLYAAQGNRSMHRKYWLKNRISYFDGKYLSLNYQNDKYTMRLYTPQIGADNFYRVYDVTAENFEVGKYYIKPNDDIIAFELAESFVPGTEYFIKADNRLTTSLGVVPPNNNYVLTPLHNQYLSVAFGGGNGQTSGPYYAVANTAYTIEAPPGAQYNDTETYVYGASQIKDLGDLSSQYLGLFLFPGETKLEKLVLGNKTNGYYNPNFSQLTIAKSAPQLKYIDISNTQLKGSLDLSNCQNLERVYACGSSVTSIPLPSYGILKEVRLPSTINTLVLNNQLSLTIDNFTIGTYNSDTKTYTMSNIGTLQTISIEGMPQFDSYGLVKLNANSLLYYCLRDINWNVPAADIIDTNDGLKGIQALETIIVRKVNPYKDGSITTPARALTGIITFTGVIDAIDTLKVYEHYSSVYPDLVFNFDESNIKHINLYDGDGNIYWSKPIAINTNITDDFYNSSAYGKFTVPQKTSTQKFKYTFENKWYIDNDSNKEVLGEYPIIDTPINTDYNFYPVFTSEIQTYTITYHINDDIVTTTAEYGTDWKETLPKLIPYSNKNEKLSNTNRMVYPFLGYSENGNEAVNNIFDINESAGVSGNKDLYAVFGTEKVDVSDSQNIFYPAWNIQYNANIRYNDTRTYDNNDLIIPNGDSSLNITEDGLYTISYKQDWNYAPFATIPGHTEDGQSIIMLQGISGTKPSFDRLYCENNSTLRVIDASTFSGCSSLTYFDFPVSLRQICHDAFTRTRLTNTTFGNINTTYIGRLAFNDSVQSIDLIKIPSNVSIIDQKAFSFNDGLNVPWSLQIGEADNFSKLDLSIYTITTTSKERAMFIQNSSRRQLDSILFYTDKCDNIDNVIGNFSVQEHFFGDAIPTFQHWDFS